MNIGQAAAESGVSAKMIRHYEAIGLIPPADRRESGYRDYSPDDIHRLHFVHRGRQLGFSIDRIRALLKLWGDRGRSNADVRKLALEHVVELEAKAAELQAMIVTLRGLAGACKRGDRPDCPIISELGGGFAAPPPPAQASRRSGRPHA